VRKHMAMRQRNPQKSYAVCGVQRSGTSLLCEALQRTRVAGRPSEYFLPWPGPDGREHIGAGRSVEDLLSDILGAGTTANGVFAVKLMWNYFPAVVERLRQLPGLKSLDPHALLPRVFPELRYVWIVREDKVRQAVSWAIAAQTNIYASFQLAHRAPAREPEFDFQLIDNLHGLILRGEAGWRHHFERAGVEPFRVAYEELAADVEGTALAVLNHLEVAVLDPPFAGRRGMVRQATGLNDEWARRYVALKGIERDGGSA
jgi:trehalose 2-sulfotransferase